MTGTTALPLLHSSLPAQHLKHSSIRVLPLASIQVAIPATAPCSIFHTNACMPKSAQWFGPLI